MKTLGKLKFKRSVRMDIDDVNTLDFIDGMNRFGDEPIVNLSEKERDSLLCSGKTFTETKVSSDDEG